MSFDAWTIFALFWALFVTTPGPNAVNCMSNGMTHGFRRSLWGVLAILTQASLFLALSALGVTALITAAPDVFRWVQLAGAFVLVALGIRAWRTARDPVKPQAGAGSIYGRAFLIATFNAKSLAGYIAAFSQFVQPDVPILSQMTVIVPTALTLTALSYTGYTALGAGLGKLAMGAILNFWVRRGLALCFIGYGIALGAYAPGGRT
ncbi:homoserine/homoserine lactone efflux protein [Dinoroseobacter shibae DFL 12 = DSM 16493]|jgi:homoserine/homoserine lactone efflux protein|uniref:Homoserine/homoserine lactone efflux protein n=1 Tax=Dinoroseobacter shibae (strain DSM 16493 / NCIMB 14021 / DFL 12) TaxID=398580 RepID=A8LL91_DINSH|nr:MULTISPECIES: LysE family translocator [Dinoroseobacter]ABV94840.1 homoserine/homoserine lactone efflux protein [Dinoroseobacter shibae DFL 12 = DSM 16493]MDD9716716.1 LysE family translocator [Dinoroseobacter sp. PD6]URF46260.1 LysE family translocator [Dinoroseobacter shibae]URF50567.1 LysE family translocator [Dinoroseobacter shibae]